MGVRTSGQGHRSTDAVPGRLARSDHRTLTTLSADFEVSEFLSDFSAARLYAGAHIVRTKEHARLRVQLKDASKMAGARRTVSNYAVLGVRTLTGCG